MKITHRLALFQSPITTAIFPPEFATWSMMIHSAQIRQAITSTSPIKPKTGYASSIRLTMIGSFHNKLALLHTHTLANCCVHVLFFFFLYYFFPIIAGKMWNVKQNRKQGAERLLKTKSIKTKITTHEAVDSVLYQLWIFYMHTCLRICADVWKRMHVLCTWHALLHLYNAWGVYRMYVKI